MNTYHTIRIWVLALAMLTHGFLMQSQTHSLVDNPDWTLDTDWSLQAPCDGGKLVSNVVLDHNSTIDFTLSVEHTLLVTQGVTLISSEEIDVKSGGTLVIEGIVILTNEGIKIHSDGMVHIKDGGEFIGEADVEFKEVSGGMVIDDGGMMTWAGDWKLNGGSGTEFIINGQVIIEGDFSNKVDIMGEGGITLYGELNNFPNASIFGCTLTGSACCLDAPCTLGITNNPLPIKLLSFDVQVSNKKVKIEWLATAEAQHAFYTVESSTDLFNWKLVATAYTSDESDQNTSYLIWDDNPTSGLSYYRLSQTNFDGIQSFLGIRSIDISPATSHLNIYPNPANTSVIINIRNIDNADILITDCNGRQVYYLKSATHTNEVDLSGLSAGLYYVQLKDSGYFETQKLVIGH